MPQPLLYVGVFCHLVRMILTEMLRNHSKSFRVRLRLLLTKKPCSHCNAQCSPIQ